MKTIHVEFNALARGGKVRVWLPDAEGVRIGDAVALVETSEEMEVRAVLSEIDGDWAYFDLHAPR